MRSFLVIVCLGLATLACRRDSMRNEGQSTQPSEVVQHLDAPHQERHAEERGRADEPGGSEAPTRKVVDDVCAGVFDDGLVDMMIAQFRVQDDEPEDWGVAFVAAGVCQHHPDARACAACLREVQEFAAGRRARRAGPPTDAELHTRFKRHRAAFDRLLAMISSEPILVGIGTDFLCYALPGTGGSVSFWLVAGKYTSVNGHVVRQEELLSAAGLTQERFDAYLAVLAEIGAYRVQRPTVRADLEPVSINVYRYGNVASSLSKDVEFFDPEHFPDGPGIHATVVECTDAMPDESNGYAPLGEGWFIHFARS